MSVFAKTARDWYESTKHPTLEPEWNLLDQCDEDTISGIGSEIGQTRFIENFPFGGRIIENGSKVGTPSWVFLGRNLPNTKIYPWAVDPAWGNRLRGGEQ